MTDALAQLMAHAITSYGFRRPNRRDTEAGYLAALIDHVAQHDLAAAHELRVGKPQAEWTPADVRAFQAALKAAPGPKTAFAAGEGVAIAGLTVPGFEVSEASLRKMAQRGLAAMIERRTGDVTAPIPIMASVLLVTGEVVTTSVGRAERIAVLKALAQQTPCFGFLLVFDAFMHAINETTGTATKTDTLLAQLGTRDLRLTMRRPYRVVDGRAVFEDPPPPDLDWRDHSLEGQDPYAEIFVSVPSASGPQ